MIYVNIFIFFLLLSYDVNLINYNNGVKIAEDKNMEFKMNI